jgi:hypothetical protein
VTSVLFSRDIGLRTYKFLYDDRPANPGVTVNLITAVVTTSPHATARDLVGAIEECREHEYPRLPSLPRVASLATIG